MKLTIIYWRDIPSQVVVSRGRQRAKQLLPAAFQHAVHRAAMRAGKGGSQQYIDDWRRDTTTLICDEPPELVARQQASALASQYDQDALEALVRAKGHSVG